MEEQDFYHKVYNVTRQIPLGRVTTYGSIAKFIGAPQSARIVGYALNASHGLPDVPAHRVVNRKGLLTGRHHFATPDLMEKRLKKEGVKIENNQIINFEKHLWQPEQH